MKISNKNIFMEHDWLQVMHYLVQKNSGKPVITELRLFWPYYLVCDQQKCRMLYVNRENIPLSPDGPFFQKDGYKDWQELPDDYWVYYNPAILQQVTRNCVQRAQGGYLYIWLYSDDEKPYKAGTYFRNYMLLLTQIVGAVEEVTDFLLDRFWTLMNAAYQGAYDNWLEREEKQYSPLNDSRLQATIQLPPDLDRLLLCPHWNDVDCLRHSSLYQSILLPFFYKNRTENWNYDLDSVMDAVLFLLSAIGTNNRLKMEECEIMHSLNIQASINRICNTFQTIEVQQMILALTCLAWAATRDDDNEFSEACLNALTDPDLRAQVKTWKANHPNPQQLVDWGFYPASCASLNGFDREDWLDVTDELDEDCIQELTSRMGRYNGTLFEQARRQFLIDLVKQVTEDQA